MTETSGADRPSWLKLPVLGLLAYWFLYALVAPVTIYDAHVYNIARLLIIQKGGFFGDHLWNVCAQLSYPWAFDAVHYPFLWLGAGFDLPSFACLVGILIVIHRLVSRRYSAHAAWWCDLAVISMPTVVYQATSTKNDLAGVFAVAVWYYALTRWRVERQRVYLFFMALALAFNAGTKFSGPPVTAILSLYSLWALRSLPWRQIFAFCGALALCFLLFGSAETYLNNYLLFKSPLGPPDWTLFHRNIDGVAGATANFIRYFFGNMDVGVDAANPQSPVANWLTNAGRETLHFVGLNNVGYRRDFDDTTFSVLKTGLEAASDYGPVGALALIAALVALVARQPRDPVWQLSACGLASMTLTCITVGWMPWNNRFLLLSFVLFGVAFTLWVLQEGSQMRVRRSCLCILLLYSAIVYPLHSYNRKPSDLALAWSHREQLELSERGDMAEIVDDLQARKLANPGEPLLLIAGPDSWTYDILKIKDLNVRPTPTLDHATLARAVVKTGATRLWVLTLNRTIDPALIPELKPVNGYGESDTFLYEWIRPDLRIAGGDQSVVTRFADGWYAQENAPDGTFRWMSASSTLNVAVERAGTLVIEAQLRSSTPDNEVQVLMDDQLVVTQPIPGLGWTGCTVRAPVPIGAHRVVFRSRLSGVQPPGDNRSLTICVKNLKAHLE